MARRGRTREAVAFAELSCDSKAGGWGTDSVSELASSDLTQEVPARAVIEQSPLAIVLTDAAEGEPIVYVNPAFEALTGHAAESVIGRNCRLLQGEKTESDQVGRLREAIRAAEPVEVLLTNYRADGSTFRNELMVAPIRDDNGNVSLFFGCLREARNGAPDNADDLMLREMQHRVKNHLQMVVSLIRMQARRAAEGEPGQDYQQLARRVESLQLLYEQLHHAGAQGVIDLGSYASQLVAAMAHLNSKPGVRIGIDAEPCPVSVDLAGHIGLVLSEIVTNALQHAFEGRDSGLVDVSLHSLAGRTMRLRVSDDGIGLPKDAGWPNQHGFGGRLVQGLAERAGARMSIDRGGTGTTFTVDFERDA